MNKFDFFGPITLKSARKFANFIDALEEDEIEVTEVVVRIFSGGGDSDAALAIVGLMKARPDIRWITEAYGCAESAASLLFAAGDERRMSHAAWIMTHPGKFTRADSTAKELLDYAHYLAKYEDHWAYLMARYTGTGVEVWESHTEEYFDANQCLSMGLATEIF